MKVNIGGERIGSGNKMTTHLRHYERSTHNLSQRFKSPIGVGILTPTYCNIALRGDKFNINVAAGVRTIPSKGALFGSYKLQVDYFLCPVRLYTGILHNNPVNIGLNMNKVYFPAMKQGYYVNPSFTKPSPVAFAKNSLLHYLGLSGIGNYAPNTRAERTFNAIPVLAYYDIFKNYYSNKQEKRAYVLNTTESTEGVNKIDEFSSSGQTATLTERGNLQMTSMIDMPEIGVTESYTLEFTERVDTTNLRIVCHIDDYTIEDEPQSIVRTYSVEEFTQLPIVDYFEVTDDKTLAVDICQTRSIVDSTKLMYMKVGLQYTVSETPLEDTLTIRSFDLSNIDEMRSELLSWHTMGAPYIINDFGKLPYSAVAPDGNATGWSNNPNQYNLNGLMLKTYQSDMFNNWLSSEYIDGVNGIANITRVSTEGGGFTIDSLNFAEKMYNLLNRIVVSGNTYEDWQSVVYENTPKRHLESPMYIGGISQEVVFEEIVQTAATDEGGLGKLGGRGISRHRKGGRIRVKCDEAAFIIGIASLTPRLNYGQGNEFFFTDVMTMDDFHKPALDGIGFQDLIGERMAYFDTIVESGTDNITRHAVGKLPAWIEYMTAVDKVHGDFADETGENSYMVLNRNYEFDESRRCIKDTTTYIEPGKYNNVFLYTERDSQNFWLQIDHDITARRKMSAKQIPNI